MGSLAYSTNTSNTAYTNAPIAQENVSNPVNLSNSANARINSNDVKNDIKTSVGGSYTNTTLDGGAIDRAFDFGSEAVKIIADLTKATNQNQAAQAAQTQNAAIAAQGETNTNAAATDKDTNKKALIVGAVIIAAAYFYFRK